MKRRIAVVSTVFAIAMVAAVGWAAYLARAPISGDVSGGDFGVEWTSYDHATADGADKCEANVNTSSGMLIVHALVYEGGSCTFTGRVGRTGDGPGRVTGVSLAGLPQGWRVSLPDGVCGTLINNQGPKTVSFTISRDMDSYGGKTTIEFDGSGLEVTPWTSYDESMCTSAD